MLWFEAGNDNLEIGNVGLRRGWSNLFGANNTKAFGVNDNREVVGVTIGALGQPDLGYYWNGTGGD